MRMKVDFNIAVLGSKAVGFRNLGRVARILGAVFLASALGAAALPLMSAAATDDSAPAGAIAGRALRLSSVEGQARVLQGGQIIADPALENQPLFEGAQVQTGNDGRVEVQLEDGSLARISPNTTVTFTVLQREGAGTRTEISLTGGLAYFELQPSTAENNLRVVYGSTSFAASSPAVVRVNMDAPPGLLAVFSGNVQVDRGNSLQLEVHNGESLSLDASNMSLYTLNETIEPDSWDGWNSDRDQALSALAADKTAASGAIGGNQGMGMSDLDANGSWYNVPGEGYVWSPYDAQDSAVGAWDPYAYGNWVNYPGAGYVFVSGYSWGFAPFNCGRWNFYDSFGWGWAPGMRCSPWWGGGIAGWGFNVGSYPRGWRPPHRPMPEPIRGHTGTVVAHGPIPVDRRPTVTVSGAPTGHRAAPVVIAGHLVQPLGPIAPRQPYDRGGNSFASHSGLPSQADRPTFVPGYSGSGGANGGASGGARPGSFQGSAPSRPHPISQAPSHAQSSGGGASHASSGGGGGGSHGGGGGSHK